MCVVFLVKSRIIALAAAANNIAIEWFIRKLWFWETKLVIFTSLVYFLGHAHWSGTMTNGLRLPVGRYGLKSKQARKNLEVIFS